MNIQILIESAYLVLLYPLSSLISISIFALDSRLLSLIQKPLFKAEKSYSEDSIKGESFIYTIFASPVDLLYQKADLDTDVFSTLRKLVN